MFFLFPFVINAQEKDSVADVIHDGWIEKMDNMLAFDLSLNNSFETFEIKASENTIMLYPNTPNNLKLKFNYSFVSFAVQFAPDFIPGNGDEELKGKTSSFELGSSILKRRWFADASYSRVKGYYLKNSQQFTTVPDRKDFIQFPDLLYKGFHIYGGYIQNDKFSLAALLSQTERQLQSSGSFIQGANIRYYSMDDQSSGQNTQKSGNLEISIDPGYAFTQLIKRNLYFSVATYLGLGYLHSKIRTRFSGGDVISFQDNLIFRWNVRSGAGFNGRSFYSGLYADISGSRYRQENSSVINYDTRINYHFFIGVRFAAPEILNKGFNKLESDLL